MTQARTIRAPRGAERTCKSWAAEGALRMLMNNLDPEVAEIPEDLVVYGGRGKAARSWEGRIGDNVDDLPTAPYRPARTSSRHSWRIGHTRLR